MIGIIGAMDMEVDGIVNVMSETAQTKIANIIFTTGKLSGIECVVAKCSPGKVNAAACAQIMALKFSPKMIINSGVAGGIGKDVHIGDVVIGTSCVQHDFDTSPIGDAKGEVAGINLTHIPCDEKYSELVFEEAKKVYDGNIFKGVIATGDQFIADGAKCLEFNSIYGAMACEMEAGSIAHICYINNIPFVGIRSISDNANESGHVDFMTFAENSSKKVIKLLCDIVNKI